MWNIDGRRIWNLELLDAKFPKLRIELIRTLFPTSNKANSINLIIFISLKAVLNLEFVVYAQAIVNLPIELNNGKFIEQFKLCILSTTSTKT